MQLILSYHKKNGNQQARNVDTMIPSVLAAFLSRFILLKDPGSGVVTPVAAVFSDRRPASIGCVNVDKPAEMPFICRCLLSKAAATLLLEENKRNLY